MSTGLSHSFYDEHGDIDTSALQNLIQKVDKQYSLLGWFKCRKFVPPRPTMRDLRVYDNVSFLWNIFYRIC